MQLQEPRFIERLSFPFISGAIPEIWDDAGAYEDFRLSFFEYLEHISTQLSIGGRVPKVPGRILQLIGVTEPRGAAELERMLDSYISEEGWCAANW